MLYFLKIICRLFFFKFNYHVNVINLKNFEINSYSINAYFLM